MGVIILALILFMGYIGYKLVMLYDRVNFQNDRIKKLEGNDESNN
jgi:hypothetical protein